MGDTTDHKENYQLADRRKLKGLGNVSQDEFREEMRKHRQRLLGEVTDELYSKIEDMSPKDLYIFYGILQDKEHANAPMPSIGNQTNILSINGAQLKPADVMAMLKGQKPAALLSMEQAPVKLSKKGGMVNKKIVRSLTTLDVVGIKTVDTPTTTTNPVTALTDDTLSHGVPVVSSQISTPEASAHNPLVDDMVDGSIENGPGEGGITGTCAPLPTDHLTGP